MASSEPGRLRVGPADILGWALLGETDCTVRCLAASLASTRQTHQDCCKRVLSRGCDSVGGHLTGLPEVPEATSPAPQATTIKRMPLQFRCITDYPA